MTPALREQIAETTAAIRANTARINALTLRLAVDLDLSRLNEQARRELCHDR